MADQVDPNVEQVSYTVSETGHRYKWMPYQPKKATRKVEPLRAEAAQYTAPATPPVSGSVTTDALKDPFGDLQPPTTQPAFPNTQQYLADETEKKLPADSLMRPGEIGNAPAGPDLMKPPSQGLEESTVRPDSEGYLAQNGKKQSQECQDPDDLLYPINQLDHLTGIRDTSIANPDNRPQTCDLGDGDFEPRQWAQTTFMWQASGLCHKPAYFEDVHLERYGHSWGPYVQPVMSGAHFFLNVPILPYKMGLNPPNECMYTLGYYRPGSCAPYMLDPLPLSVRAGLVQAGAVVGMGYLIP